HFLDDRLLRPRGDHRLRHPLDPHERAAAVAAILARDRLERVDPVGARVLAEAEEDHAGRAHARSIARSREISQAPIAAIAIVAATVRPRATATPAAGIAFPQRASRRSWLTNSGIVAHSAIDRPASHHARDGSDRIATSTSTIATRAKGQFVCTTARLRPSRI